MSCVKLVVYGAEYGAECGTESGAKQYFMQNYHYCFA